MFTIEKKFNCNYFDQLKSDPIFTKSFHFLFCVNFL